MQIGQTVRNSWRTMLVGAAALTLASCSTASDMMGFEEPVATACPVAGILKDTEHLQKVRPGSAGDVTDLVVQADVLRVAAVCTQERDSDQVSVYLEFLLDASLGPAASTPDQSVPYFVALVQEDRVLKKTIGQAFLEFDDQVRLSAVQSVEDFVFVPAPELTADHYQVLVGFQLTEEQLAANRARQRR